MNFLYWLTFAVNLLGLVLALWLGLYLVSRSPKRLIAWLTALTLWSLAGLFINVLLAINPPPSLSNQTPWLRYMYPFWSEGMFKVSQSHWLQGWSIIPGFALWNHATALMRPGQSSVWRRIWILIGYLLALLAVLAHLASPILYTLEGSDPLFVNSLRPSPWYPSIAIAMILLGGSSVANLLHTLRATLAAVPRRQFQVMVSATLVAGLAILVSITGSVLGLPVPIAVLSLVEAIPVVMIGYGVARYSALVEGRTIQRDFLYNLALLVSVLGVYLLASFILVRVYLAPPIILVFVPVLAVITHTLMTSAHRLMDWLFYHREARLLRANLQRLVRLAGEGAALEENLVHALDTLCISVRASYGLILAFEGQAVVQVAAYHWRGGPVEVKKKSLTCDDVVIPAPGQFPVPLDEAALLVPLYVEAEQLGAIVLGCPINGVQFAREEVERLTDLADQIGDLIDMARRKASYLSQIARLAEAGQNHHSADSASLPVEAVETALRNLFDYAFLADTPLSELRLVQAHLPPGQVTYLERGKTVHEILLEALDKLRPGSAPPRNPPPREWHPYLILRGAYLEETSNRDLMLRLYISEGTFNRTRRAAVRALARALGEMEAAAA